MTVGQFVLIAERRAVQLATDPLVNGAFVTTFVHRSGFYEENARYELDMSGMSPVKVLHPGAGGQFWAGVDTNGDRSEDA